jgi:hypothetical protein
MLVMSLEVLPLSSTLANQHLICFFALSLLSVYIRSARMRMGFAELPKAAAIEEQGNTTPLLARSSSLNSLHT